MFYVVSPHKINAFQFQSTAAIMADVEAEGGKTWAMVTDHDGNRLTTHFARSVNTHKKPSFLKKIFKF